jgi:uncharacterized membrane protein
MTELLSRGFGKERLQALSDGIFSIVMTLLVLELISDEVAAAKSEPELIDSLLDLWPKVVSYLISFAVAGAFWVAQHGDVHHLERTDARYLWLSIFFLFWISLLPFSSAMLGEHHQYAIAEILYGWNMILASLSLHLTWWYAVRHRLLLPGLNSDAIRRAHRRLLLGPPIYLLAIGLAHVNPHTSYALYVITAVLYVIAGIIPDRLRVKALRNPLDDPD